jgi:hypothetical protein
LLIDDPEVEVDVCVYQGGYGSGKTWAGSLLGILLCCAHPGALGLVVAKTFPLLRDTTLKTYFEHLERLGLVAGEDYFWRATEARLIFPAWGNSQVLFRHLQSPEKLKSLNIAWIHVEEMSQIAESDFLMLLSRLRQTGIGRYRLFGTTNPEQRRGWLSRYFATDRTQTLEEEGQTPKKIRYRRIFAPSTENIHLSKSYLENMKQSFDSTYYKRNVMGEDADTQNELVCKTWGRANIEPSLALDDKLPLYLSCDFNIDPMSWTVAQRVNGEYHYLDELCLENCTITEAAEEFFERYFDAFGNSLAGIRLTGDASGANRHAMAEQSQWTHYRLLARRLSELGFRRVEIDIRSSNPPVASRVAAWNAACCNQHGVRRVKVHPRCAHLIANCESLRYIPGTSRIWEPSAHEIARDNQLKFTKHIWDAASYLVERYDPIDKSLKDVNTRNKTTFLQHTFRPTR